MLSPAGLGEHRAKFDATGCRFCPDDATKWSNSRLNPGKV